MIQSKADNPPIMPLLFSSQGFIESIYAMSRNEYGFAIVSSLFLIHLLSGTLLLNWVNFILILIVHLLLLLFSLIFLLLDVDRVLLYFFENVSLPTRRIYANFTEAIL